MEEEVYNCFVFLDKNQFIKKAGIKAHSIDGDDKEKFDFLENNVEKDVKNCYIFDLSLPEPYESAIRNGHHCIHIFEEYFQKSNVTNDNPLVVTTPVDMATGKLYD
ncbi:MAG: hypothetical protein H7A23_09035 [Leptospiraceae bacterium]|nr:hypothetical protein [Leptospiraceae bacterium]MCP5494687.1 hypothetical protein [Leptospiraceae bacterium]